nr:LSU ribosomal protein L15P [uncultured archaeon]
MMHKRRKYSRQIGSRTYGWGKNHRGSGNRGGVGNAGRGKKAQSKKPQIWGTDYFGRYGFTSKSRTPVAVCINLKDLESFMAKKKIDTIDLGTEGYTKLLANGSVSRKLTIIVSRASPKAIEKVKAAGGSVELKE